MVIGVGWPRRSAATGSGARNWSVVRTDSNPAAAAAAATSGVAGSASISTSGSPAARATATASATAASIWSGLSDPDESRRTGRMG